MINQSVTISQLRLDPSLNGIVICYVFQNKDSNLENVNSLT